MKTSPPASAAPPSTAEAHRPDRKPRKGSWVPHFLGLEDHRTPEQRVAFVRALERHIRENPELK